MGTARKIIKLKPETFQECVEVAANILIRGGVVALPTDTIYGVTTLLEHSDKLFQLKNRNRSKPLGLFLANSGEVPKYCKETITPELASALLPGPVTLLLERKPSVPHFFNPDSPNVGVRVPCSKLVSALCAKVGQPLAQTSANISGSSVSPLCVDDFADSLPEIDLILDGGQISVESGDSNSSGSTIVNLTVSGKYSIIRDGCAKDDTEKVLLEHGLTSL